MKITKLETMHIKPRWLFLKVHTDEGIIGWGEPVVEGRAQTVETAVQSRVPRTAGVFTCCMFWILSSAPVAPRTSRVLIHPERR